MTTEYVLQPGSYQPQISILCPSRGRPGFARELHETIRASADNPEQIELIIRVDEDDPTIDRYADQLGGSDVRVFAGARTVLSKCWNEAADLAQGDILMLCGDDIRFRTVGWDTIVQREIYSVADRLVLVYGRDGIQDDRVATHPFMHRVWMDAVGYFVPPLFASDYNDLWLTEVAREIGRLRYVPEIYTEHMHPAVGKHDLDQTHQERLARHRDENCDQLYRDTWEQRAQDVEKLQAAINSHQEAS